jgi:hypothetical protein
MSTNTFTGQVQTGATSSNNVNTTTTTPSKTTITTDVDIFPVGNSINPSNYVYDGQTILMINSTINPNANVVKAQYFDPISGQVPPLTSSGVISPNFSNWNYDMVNTSYLNGAYSASALLAEPTYLYNNLQPITNALGQYTLDIENGNEQTIGGASDDTMFFTLTSQPSVCYQGKYYITPGESNVLPYYTANNSDNFLFTANYYVQQKNEILIIQLVFTVSNTNSLNAQNSGVGISSGAPTVSVIVYNKVISKDALANLASGASMDGTKTKVYTAGPIPLQFTQPGTTFSPKTSSHSINNNVPIVIAPGYQKQYATLPLIYVAPAYDSSTGNYYARYLNDSQSSSPGAAYYIENNLLVVDTSRVVTTSYQSVYGYFTVGVAYSTDYATFQPGSCINAEILIRNIWRSPIAIYQSYQAYSTNDMATKQVVLLFGKTFNGGTFLVTNSGTPLSLIDNYAVTSLRNFMSIMRAVIATYDGTVPLVDYFINPNVIQNLNSTALSFNINVLTLQPLLDGGIMNPPSILSCPNMWYMLVKSPNSGNISVDPTNQLCFGQSIGANYFGLPNSLLCATGDARYYSSDLNMLAVANGQLFGNSIFVGANTINGQVFYTLLILPEALFNGTPLSTTNNTLAIYSTVNTIFYIIASANSSSQFVPSSTSITSTGSSSSSGSTFSITPTYNISKIVLSVSNVPII